MGKHLLLVKMVLNSCFKEVTNNGTIVVTGGENESGSLIATDASVLHFVIQLYIPATEWKLVGIPVSGLTVDDIDDNLATNGSKVGIGTMIQNLHHGSFYYSSHLQQHLSQTRGYEMMHKLVETLLILLVDLRTVTESTTTTVCK